MSGFRSIAGIEGKPLAWSALDRPGALAQAESQDFDLVILGGGITGAGVAREAALRGLSFLLVDQHDFAFGTSSRSSKLVHGGLRYLPQGDLALVRESASERNWLHAALPNLVRPLGFYYCAFEGSRDTPFTVRAGLLLYQLIAGLFGRDPSPGPLRFLQPADLARLEPTFTREGLRLAGSYFDTATDDARLVIETLKEARDLSGGRSVVLNHARALGFQRSGGRVRAVEVEDRLTGRVLQVRTGCVVNATGVWTGGTLGRAGLEPLRLRPTKGVHIVVPTARVGHRQAFSLRCAEDGRFVFLLNRGEVSVVGTTDTDYTGSLEDPRCEPEERDYLLRTVNAYFPEARLGPEDVLSSYAGLRPLLDEPGRTTDVSRHHLVRDAGEGVVSITGGKLTTFRIMAFETLRQCARSGYLRPLRGREARQDFSHRPYKVGLTWAVFDAQVAKLGLAAVLPEATRRHLHQKYGRGALAILQEVRRCPALGEPLVAGHPWCAAELQHLLAFEAPVHLDDLMARRTEMRMVVPPDHQPELARRVAGLMAVRLGWDDTRRQTELAAYLNTLSAHAGL